MASTYKVIVLFDGFSHVSEEGMSANCSCTLITGPQNIIVDTMTAWDAEKIVNALMQHNLKPEEIRWVVCSHGHSDHIGNNNLFLNAKHIVGYAVSHKECYFGDNLCEKDGIVIDKFVKVIPTPGHTSEDVSVLVETDDEGIVAIVGDLFEREEDILNERLWKEVAGSVKPELQKINRAKIVKIADYIVPGHGPKFKVTSEIKKLFNEMK